MASVYLAFSATLLAVARRAGAKPVTGASAAASASVRYIMIAARFGARRWPLPTARAARELLKQELASEQTH